MHYTYESVKFLPDRTVEALANPFRLTVPGSGDTLANRLSDLGALTGYTAGIGMD